MQATSDRSFQSLYISVMTAALYGCTWFGCFYWPSFLGYLVFPQQIVQIEMIAGIIVLPLGLIILGALEGMKAAAGHLLLSLLALGASIGFVLVTGRDSDIDFARRLILIVIFLTYAVAGTLSCLRRIKKEAK